MSAPRGAAHPLVAVYADESCLGNGQDRDTPGGAGGVVEFRQPQNGIIVRRDYWVAEPSTTNNQMALRSVIEAAHGLSVKRTPLSVVFTSDSKYLIDGLREWVFAWSARGWKRKTGPIENLELWCEALAALRSSGHEFAWRWIRGHDGHAQNEYAHHLASSAAASQTSSRGFVPSAFDRWLADGDQSLIRPPDPFPDPAAFVPARTVPDPCTR